jgi:hypothetical protein
MDPDEFKAKFDSISDPAEKRALVEQGVAAWATNFGILTATLMELVDDREWKKAMVLSSNMAESLNTMSKNFLLLGVSDPRGRA